MHRRGIVPLPAVRKRKCVAFLAHRSSCCYAVSLSAKADTKRKERLLWLFVRLCRCLSLNGAGVCNETQRPHGHRAEGLGGSGDGDIGGPPDR